jgi:hypothetical protein
MGAELKLGQSQVVLFVSPGHLAWSRGLSASQSAHNFMYINPHHRPLGDQRTIHLTSHFISCSQLLTLFLKLDRIGGADYNLAATQQS